MSQIGFVSYKYKVQYFIQLNSEGFLNFYAPSLDFLRLYQCKTINHVYTNG